MSIEPVHPTAPVMDDRYWRQTEAQAAAFSRTGLVPAALRGKPDDTLLVLVHSDEMGIPRTQGLAHLYPIEGRICPSAQIMTNLVLRAGHEIWIEESSSERCTAVGRRRGTDRDQRVTWTIEDAKTAGLNSKDVWKKYPAAMLRARALSNLCRSAFPDVLMGMQSTYTPEELGSGHSADADADEQPMDQGEVVDVQAIEPAETIDAKLVRPQWRQDFAIACQEKGLGDAERHAIIDMATQGRTRTSKELRVAEVPDVKHWFAAVTEGDPPPYRFLDLDGVKVIAPRPAGESTDAQKGDGERLPLDGDAAA